MADAFMKLLPTACAAIVRAVVRSPRPPSQKQVAEWADDLPLSPKRQQIELHIRHVNVEVIGDKGVLFDDDNDSIQDSNGKDPK